jgi:hypothetical protein
MCPGPLVPHDERMHPELSLQIAQLRHDELTNARRFRHTTDPVARRRFFRRRRDTQLAAETPPAPLVLLPPPREERDPTGHGLVA